MIRWQAANSIWERLAHTRRPIVLYGMGDGADKTLAQCRARSIPVAAVFASDGFVRGQSYQGYPVRTLAQVEAELGDFLVLLCFASERPEVLAQIRAVAARHPLLVPDLPVAGDTQVTPAYLEERAADIAKVEALLADDQSRRVLEEVLLYKLTGEPERLWRCETPRAEALALLGLGGGETYVDAGAYTGDTVEEFAALVGGDYREILAIEPDRRNFAGLKRRVARLGLPRVTCVQAGAWSAPGALAFNHRSGRQAALSGDASLGDVSLGEVSPGEVSPSDASPKVPVDTIDRLLGGRPATYLKLDVEGAEAEALAGGAVTIRRYRPRLAVAAYHRGGDLLDIPLQIHALHPGYGFYLRHHPYLPAWETNYYCLPKG